MKHLEIEYRKEIGLIWFDQPGESVNTLNRQIMVDFPTILDQLASNPSCLAVVLISGKKSGFIAGADVELLQSAEDAIQAEALSKSGQVLLDRIANFPKPIIAAVHGACLGGGLEVALACHYRIAAKNRKTVLGLPEVKLGLLPGGGGTQRLPRQIGLGRALEAMLTGKNIYARRALQLGLVDMLVPLEGLADSATAFARGVIDHGKRNRTKQPLLNRLLESNPLGRLFILRMAKKSVLAKTLGNYPAPLEIIAAVKAGYTSKKKGFEQESKGFGRLVVSPQGQALMKLFFSMNTAKKMPTELSPLPIRRLGIVGAGLMGTGIAEVSACEGLDVYLKDLHIEGLAKAEKSLSQGQEKLVRKRIKSAFDADRFNSFIHFCLDGKQLSRADLVIEAVFEDLAIKHEVLAEIERITQPRCIFASNTSAIPIKDIAAKSKRPDQVIGMHYFSPVAKMPLLEIIVTPETAPWVRATAWALGIKQAKHVIVVQDGPGFYTTRILAPMLNEALLLLDEGADIIAVDRAMRQFGFPVGPFTLMDEVGIDVGAHVSKSLSPMFAQRGGITSVGFEKLAAAGYEGRKNGKGFYQGGGGKKVVNAAVYPFFEASSRKIIAIEEIQNRLVFMMINEAAYCLQEAIISHPRDGDLGAILGLGFPPFLGGPFHWMDQLKPQKVLDQLRKFADQFGARFKPADIIFQRRNRSFY